MKIAIAAFLLILCIACAYLARKMEHDEAYQRQMRSGPPPEPISTYVDERSEEVLREIRAICEENSITISDEVIDDE